MIENFPSPKEAFMRRRIREVAREIALEALQRTPMKPSLSVRKALERLGIDSVNKAENPPGESKCFDTVIYVEFNPWARRGKVGKPHLSSF